MARLFVPFALAPLLCAVIVSPKVVGVSLGNENVLRHCKAKYETILNCERSVPARSKRLAVLVGGPKERFYPIPTLRHVVAPAAKAGFSVDFYVMLAASLPGSSFKAYWYRPVANPWIANLSQERVEEYVVRHASHYGASRVHLSLQHKVALDSLPQSSNWTRWLGHSGRTVQALHRNLLWLQNFEMLWNWTEQVAGPGAYDQYLLVRSDIHWVQDLDLTGMQSPFEVYSKPFGPLCLKKHIADVPDDRAFLVGGKVAKDIFTAHTAYYNEASGLLDSATRIEDFIIKVARLRGVRWNLMRADLWPFWPGLHMRQPEWSQPLLCLRGIRRSALENPTGDCVHPKVVRYPFCDDYELL